MSGYSFSAEMPAKWDDVATRGAELFNTLGWQNVIEKSFGARSIYAWNTETACGAALSIFKAGPFTIGYFGFPIGAVVGSAAPDATSLLSWCNQPAKVLPTCIRIPVSAFGAPVEYPLAYESNPETAILGLQNWALSSVSKNLRRDVKKAMRSDLVVTAAVNVSEGGSLFRIYEATVRRHAGTLRYNESYFRALVDLSLHQTGLRILVARHGVEIAGFAIIVRHAGTAYYLHGGTASAYRQYSPNDLLLNEAIQLAQRDGAECFNLMSSPNDQPSLVKYKEKWGGTTKEHRTYTLPIRRSYRIMTIAEKLYRIIR